MCKSILFLILPVYEDGENVRPPYLIALTDGDPRRMKTLSDNLNRVIEFFDYENLESVYYDSLNMSMFANHASVNDDGYPKYRRQLQITMHVCGKDWRTEKTTTTDDVFQWYRQTISDDTLCEMSKRKSETPDDSYLLLDFEALKGQPQSVPVTCNGMDMTIDARKLDEKGIAEWYAGNRRPARTFEANPKHGQDGVGAYPHSKGKKVSKLECSPGEAQQLLNSAVGKAEDKSLYNYDKVRKKYMEFKYNGYGNTYHGYHLCEKQSESIPNEAKKKIDRLYKE